MDDAASGSGNAGVRRGRWSGFDPIQILSVAQSSVYPPPRPANHNDLELMRRIDQLFTALPFLDSRRMTAMLNGKGCRINRKRVQQLMRKMVIAALGPKPRTTKPVPGQNLPVSPAPYGDGLAKSNVGGRYHPVPIGRGFLYLVVILDRASRAVLARRLSNTLEYRSACLRSKRPRRVFGRPEIFNIGRGSQFTSAAFTGALAATGVRTSMDGRGRSATRAAVTDAFGEEVGGYASRNREAWTTLRVAHIPTATTAASNISVQYWEEGAAAAPLKKPDPVVLSIGSPSRQPRPLLHPRHLAYKTPRL